MDDERRRDSRRRPGEHRTAAGFARTDGTYLVLCYTLVPTDGVPPIPSM